MLFVIRKKYNELRVSEQKVADVLLEGRIPIEELTITALAKEAGVSQASVLRLAEALGTSGFKELKLSLIRADGDTRESRGESRLLYGHSVSGKEELKDIPAKTIYASNRLLEETLKAISVTEYQRAVEALRGANNIVVYGVENSGCTVLDLVTKLMYLGLNCRSYSDYYLQSVSARHLGSEDVAVGISYSGSSKDTVDTMRIAKEAGAKTIAITNFQKTCISRYADIILCTGNQQLLCGETIFSRTTQMAVNDMLYTGILVSDFETYEGRMESSSGVIANRAYENVENLHKE